jgi:hypothetical protein
VKYSDDQKSWTHIDAGKVFQTNVSNSSMMHNWLEFETPVTARYWLINPITWTN